MGNRAARLSPRKRPGQRRYTDRSGPAAFGAHYFEARPLRGLDTVQRGRVLDARAGNRTACSLAYQAVNKTRWDPAAAARCCLSLPARPPLSRSTSGVNANLSSRFFFPPSAVTTLPHDATPPPPPPPQPPPPPLPSHPLPVNHRLTVLIFYGYMETILQRKDNK